MDAQVRKRKETSDKVGCDDGHLLHNCSTQPEVNEGKGITVFPLSRFSYNRMRGSIELQPSHRAIHESRQENVREETRQYQVGLVWEKAIRVLPGKSGMIASFPGKVAVPDSALTESLPTPRD